LGKIDIHGERYLTFSYSRPVGLPDLEYRVEVSENLTDWHRGDERPELVSIVPQGDAEVVTIRDAEPIESLTARLIRLRVKRKVQPSP
jgi:hypothetical protein